MPAARSLLRGAARLPSAFSRRFVGSFNKSPPPANKGVDAEQALPLGAYYEAIIAKPQPIPERKPEEPPQSSPKAPGKSSSRKTTATARKKASPPATAHADESTETAAIDTSPASPPTLSAEPSTAQEKARIVFGSRLAGPAEREERLQELRDQSTLVAGILVPPKPEEPENCCMGGCVNCVWDRYRDEMEEWAAATAKAQIQLQAQGPRGAEQEKRPSAPATRTPAPAIDEAISMDDDGGGSNTNWDINDIKQPQIAKDLWDDGLYNNVPVGIREFMKTEKRLKERHQKEGTVGG
jgi:hypothetical protein